MSKFHKTIITMTVLSDRDISNMEVDDIVEQTITGDCAMIEVEQSSEIIDSKAAAEMAIEGGNDPEFFGIDKDGNPAD